MESIASSTQLTLFGTPTCADCQRSRALLSRLEVPFMDIDISIDALAADRAQQVSGRLSTPVLLFPDASVLVEPTDAELENKLRTLSLMK